MNQFALISNAIDGEISVFHLDGDSGALSPVASFAADAVVMPIAVSADQQRIFAATRGVQPALMEFSMDTVLGGLTVSQKTPIDYSKAYLNIDRAGKYLLGASYGQNILGVYAIGGHTRPIQIIEDIEHAHCVIVSDDNRFVYVSALGSDLIIGFALTDNEQSPLVEIGRFALDKGFGPRHFRLSPSGKHLYVLSEFRGSIAVFERDVQAGSLHWRSESDRPAALSHLRDGFARPNFDHPIQPDPNVLSGLVWAADLQVHPSGKFVYASERNAHVLLKYRVTDEGGSLAFVEAMETVKQPRGIKIDHTGQFLLACGEKSTQVVVYRIDIDTGALALVSRAEGGLGANWIELVEQTACAKPITLETR